jgi:hypothetical protein
MAHNILAPDHQVDASGATLVAAVAPLELPEYIRSEVEQYPEFAGKILTEAVTNGELVEQPDLEERVLDALMAHAPEVDDRQHAAVEKLVFLLRQENAEARARTELLLADLTAPGVPQQGPALKLAGELVKHGRWEEALGCFNVASRNYLSAGVEKLSEFDLLVGYPLLARERLRRELGYAPDEFDMAVRDRPDPDEVMAGLLAPAEAPSRRPGARSGRHLGRQVFCSREDFVLAVESGFLAGEDTEKGVDAYFRAGERALREYSGAYPDRDWYTVLFSVGEIREFARGRGGDTSDRELHGEWADTLARDDPRLRFWPPERNQRCWCASGRKYKKCCGSPNSR